MFCQARNALLISMNTVRLDVTVDVDHWSSVVLLQANAQHQEEVATLRMRLEAAAATALADTHEQMARLQVRTRQHHRLCLATNDENIPLAVNLHTVRMTKRFEACLKSRVHS
jgi:hypothetical protein